MISRFDSVGFLLPEVADDLTDPFVVKNHRDSARSNVDTDAIVEDQGVRAVYFELVPV